MTPFQTLPTCSLCSVSFKMKAIIARTEANSILNLWVIQWRISAIGRIQFENGFFGRTIALRHAAVIDCLIKWMLSTIAQPWTAPVSVLGHRWPTFSLFPPGQSPLFAFAMSRIFYLVQCSKRQGGVSIISEWPLYFATWLTVGSISVCEM